MHLFGGVEGSVDDLSAEVESGLKVFADSGDDAALGRLLSRRADVCWLRCQFGPMEDAVLRALEHARRAGDEAQIADLEIQLAHAAVIGPLPVVDARRRCDELLATTPADTGAKGLLLVLCGLLAAMAGEPDEAGALCGRGRTILSMLGLRVGLAALTTWTSAVGLMAGDSAAAERDLLLAVTQLRAVGERGNIAALSAQLAEALLAQGRYDEAAALATASVEQAASEDIHAHIVARAAGAKAAAGLGRTDEAVAIAREAVTLAEATDSPVLAGDALLALAVALAAAAEWDAALATADDAQVLYDAKGHVPASASVRAFIEEQAEARTASTTA